MAIQKCQEFRCSWIASLALAMTKMWGVPGVLPLVWGFLSQEQTVDGAFLSSFAERRRGGRRSDERHEPGSRTGQGSSREAGARSASLDAEHFRFTWSAGPGLRFSWS